MPGPFPEELARLKRARSLLRSQHRQRVGAAKAEITKLQLQLEQIQAESTLR